MRDEYGDALVTGSYYACERYDSESVCVWRVLFVVRVYSCHSCALAFAFAFTFACPSIPAQATTPYHYGGIMVDWVGLMLTGDSTAR